MQLKEMQTKDPLPAQEMQRWLASHFARNPQGNCSTAPWKTPGPGNGGFTGTPPWLLQWHALTTVNKIDLMISSHPLQFSRIPPKRVIHFIVRFSYFYHTKTPPVLSALKQHGFDTSKSGTTTALRCGNLDAVDAVGHGLSFHRAFGGANLGAQGPSV